MQGAERDRALFDAARGPTTIERIVESWRRGIAIRLLYAPPVKRS
jgi:hypothetical protein